MTRRLIAVHGFGYDGSPQGGFDARIAKLTGRGVTGFPWFSAPTRPASFLRAWMNGHWNHYRWAYRDLAVRAAQRLAEGLEEYGATEGPPDLVCHSLGSLVALKAAYAACMNRSVAALKPVAPIRNLILLNAAAIVDDVLVEVSAPLAERALNVVVDSDAVLYQLARRFSGKERPVLGVHGLQVGQPSWWSDLHIDGPGTRRAARETRGWTLSGDDPGSWLDHFWTIEAGARNDNAAAIRAWMAGDDLDGMVA